MMQFPIAISTPSDHFKAKLYHFFKWPYLTFTLGGYLLITLIVLLYLGKAPVYKSELELVLPGTGTSSSVSIDNVGQVVSTTSAPFSGGGYNPRVNYKEMLSSRGVLALAREKMFLSELSYGLPKVKLTTQTSILAVSVIGISAEQANAKAWALYQSLQEELNRLRADEIRRRDESTQGVLDDYQVRLNEARANILQFQEGSFLVSQDHLILVLTILKSIK
jgi:capsule polysaccharide export protein KpsE/RkpR